MDCHTRPKISAMFAAVTGRAWDFVQGLAYAWYLIISNFVCSFTSGLFSRQGFLSTIQKFAQFFLPFYQNLVDFLQTNFTNNLLYITTTYSEKPEGASSQERWIFRVFKNPVIFKPRGQHSIVPRKHYSSSHTFAAREWASNYWVSGRAVEI